MAFVSEKISDADKARIDFSQIEHPIYGRGAVYPSEWTIDREQDIALISLGGGENPSVLILLWKGQVINVFANIVFTGNFTTNDMEVTWSVVRVEVPSGIERARVMATLKKALETFGYVSGKYRDKIKSVTVDFTQFYEHMRTMQAVLERLKKND